MAQAVFGESIQAALSGMAPSTIAWPYGCFNATGPLFLNSGASGNIYKGYVATAPGSVVGAFFLGAAANAVSGNVVVYKNNTSFFTALAGANFPGSGAQSSSKAATFNNGVYTYTTGDYFDAYYTGSGANLYMGVGLLFNQSLTSMSGVSTVLSANTTVAASDNQRVWQASGATQYTLTLPATNAAQDFYVRVVVVAGAGVKIQAPAGVTIYNGASASAAGGTLTATAAGAYATLYNPAGTNLWTMTDPSSVWTAA